MADQIFLGKYTVIRPLDEGGMSRIYLARQAATGREVVVKVLKTEYRIKPETVEYFRREIHITTHFQHPRAVAAVDSALNSPSGPILVMEYLRGIDLHQLICRQGRFPVGRAIRLIGQLCDVLQVAHDSGIIHRDIKPGNCMILHAGTQQEILKLMDFGLAKMQSVLYIAPEEVDDPRLPVTAGTPEYICPELVRGQEIDHRADLYSVGVILFEMLAGRRPFTGPTSDDLLQAHMSEPPPSFASLDLGKQIPAEVEAVVLSCLAKSPDDRPANAAELARRLTKAMGGTIFIPQTNPPQANRPSASGLVARPKTLGPGGEDRNAIRLRMEVNMLEAMALVKIKGFIHDLGGNIIESVPGLIKVRLPDPNPPTEKKSGLLGWLDKGGKPIPATQVIGPTDVELHMERANPEQPSQLTLTLLMRPAGRGLVTPTWRSRCNQIGRDLQAYMMGR